MVADARKRADVEDWDLARLAPGRDAAEGRSADRIDNCWIGTPNRSRGAR